MCSVCVYVVVVVVMVGWGGGGFKLGIWRSNYDPPLLSLSQTVSRLQVDLISINWQWKSVFRNCSKSSGVALWMRDEIGRW
jgi:hypothetical protein